MVDIANYDYIIIGAGSAGCVLAYRLGERPENKILVLEAGGKLTLLDQNRVIRANPYFRLFSTTNTIGLGDTTGLYHGTQQINQGQMDRWNIVATLNYLPHGQECAIVMAKLGIDPKDAAARQIGRAHV